MNQRPRGRELSPNPTTRPCRRAVLAPLFFWKSPPLWACYQLKQSVTRMETLWFQSLCLPVVKSGAPPCLRSVFASKIKTLIFKLYTAMMCVTLRGTAVDGFDWCTFIPFRKHSSLSYLDKIQQLIYCSLSYAFHFSTHHDSLLCGVFDVMSMSSVVSDNSRWGQRTSRHLHYRWDLQFVNLKTW